MKLVLFHQYDQLLAKIREVARCCAKDAADWKICRVQSSGGNVHLHDRTMNVLAVTGGETRIVVPDIDLNERISPSPKDCREAVR